MISVNGTTRTVRVDGKQGTELSINGFSVRVIEGPDAGLSLSGNVGTVRIGTAPTNELVLTDGVVSRQHAEIKLTQKGLMVQDLGSKNGTWVNEVRIETGFVPDRGRVRVGGTLMELEFGARRMVIFSEPETSFGGMLSHSQSMWNIFGLVKQLARFDLPVMIHGETGTGKDLVARSLHSTGPRKERPFVILDCGSVVGSLLASQIFGTEKGAFTGADRARAGVFEQADGGTVFLDEIGELDLELQSNLLRVVESKEVQRLGSNQGVPVNFRLVSATNRDLEKMVADGQFRSDLFYRLSSISMKLPPLRERPEDIIPLAVFYLDSCARKNQIAMPSLDVSALSALNSYCWKGNVRELRNAMEVLCALSGGKPITGADVIRVIPAAGPGGPVGAPPRPSLAKSELPPNTPVPVLKVAGKQIRNQIEDVEKEAIQSALVATGWNRSKAAQRLGLSRSALYAKIDRYGIRQPGVVTDDDAD